MLSRVLLVTTMFLGAKSVLAFSSRAAFSPALRTARALSTTPTMATMSPDAIAEKCLAAKKASGLTYDAIADKMGYTNAYTCQLLLGQAQLKPDAKAKLAEVLPKLDKTTLESMMECPFRTFDSEILKEPHVYRTYEAVTHYGKAIKSLINEKFGDGIMSAIDFYLTVGETTGKTGERRVVITFNGKFLPFIEQIAADNKAPSPNP